MNILDHSVEYVLEIDRLSVTDIQSLNAGTFSEDLEKLIDAADALVFEVKHAPIVHQIVRRQSMTHKQTARRSRLFKILKIATGQIPARDLIMIQPDFILTESNPQERQIIFDRIKASSSKEKQVLAKKSEILKKGEELESFNILLSKESQKKIELIQKFLDVEEVRKRTEKKLLYFLDMINLEIEKPNFIQLLLSFLWKENSCSEFALMIGFQLEEPGTVFTVFYDGKDERIFQDKKIHFHESAALSASAQLANLLKRPTAPLQIFHLLTEKRNFHFFYEVKTSNPELLQIKNTFFQDRLSILAMATSNWLIDHKISAQFELWNYIFESWQDPVHLIDHQFHLIKSNYTSNQGSPDLFCYKVLAGRDQPCFGCPVVKGVSQGSIEIEDKRHHAIRSIYQNENKTLNLVFYQDMTSADLLKKEFIQSEKLKLLGQLSNHLSHELNNPLTGLKLQAEFLVQQTEQTGQKTVFEDFVQIVDGLRRSIDIIHDLQSFTHQNEVHIQDQDISKAITSVLRLLKSISREVRLFVDVKKFVVQTNQGLLQQTLYNLIKNSCEAMNFKGTVKIYSEEDPQNYFLIIEDNGPGLPDYVRSNLFKPFISTKESTGGTGLGLFISYESCRKMNIDFTFDENFKNGARFKLGFKK